MIPYFVVFATAIFLFAIAENEKQHDRKTLSAFLVSAGIVLLCAFAGARDTGIGTDTSAYGAWLFNLATNDLALPDFMKKALNDGPHMDFLFALQAYVVVQLTGSQFWYYFAIELAMLVPIYLAVKDIAAPSMVSPTMALYLIVFFIPGLNAMRQYIAMSFVLLSCVRLYKRNFVSGAALMVCAILYHSSAIIGIVPVLAWVIFFKREPDGQYELRECSKIAAPLALVAITVFLINLRPVVDWATTTFDFLSKYRYALSYNGASHRAFYVFYGAMLFSIVALALKNESRSRALIVFLACIVFLAFPIQTLEVYSQALQRLARYMLLFSIPLFALSLEAREPLFKSDILYCATYVCAIAAFVFFFAICGNNDAIPYASALIGI